jgi:hypothetical protein
MAFSLLNLIILLFLQNHTALVGIQLSEDDARLESHCQHIEDFMKILRQDLFEETKNPFKYILITVGRGNEYGKQSITSAMAQYNELLSKLDITTNRDINLASALGKQFVEVPYCMPVADTANFVFKLLKYDFVTDKTIFLQTFLNTANKQFTIRFILYTLENILESSEQLTHELIVNYYSSSEEMIDEFISLFDTIIQLNKKTDNSDKQKTYKNVVNVAVSQGKAFLGIFLLYQFKGLFQDNFSDYGNFFIDHFVLCKIGAFLTTIIQDIASLKPKAQIVNLSKYFVEIHDRKLMSKNVVDVEQRFTENNIIADDCPQCFARREAQRISTLESEGNTIRV